MVVKGGFTVAGHIFDDPRQKIVSGDSSLLGFCTEELHCRAPVESYVSSSWGHHPTRQIPPQDNKEHYCKSFHALQIIIHPFTLMQIEICAWRRRKRGGT